jgi:16S rRNA (cytidine1402-2'-O)-methyltransferase
MSTLYVVATPLGNLEDLTLRAVRILGQVEVVAAESLSRARGLLTHLQIKGRKLISCRESNRESAARRVCACLQAGQEVALISDAGTPGLNDPAAAVVKLAAREGFTLCPVLGPSAISGAWSVAGIDHAPFAVLGFLPARAGDRETLLKEAAATGWPLLFFEAPHRLKASAELLARIFPERRLVICREMSKLHERIVHTTCREIPALLEHEPDMGRGEFTLVMEGKEQAPLMTGLELMVKISQGMSSSQLAAYLARESGGGKKDIYREILRLKKESSA